MTFALTPQQVDQFKQDGYLLVEGLYDQEEMELLLKIGKADEEKQQMISAPTDTEGRESKLLSLIHI